MSITPLALCVYCGSRSGTEAAYADAAREVGTLIGKRGWQLVYGGGRAGLMGLVADAFKEDVIKRLEGASAIGHNRYSTQGQSHLKNAQPFVVEYSQGPIAIRKVFEELSGKLQ